MANALGGPPLCTPISAAIGRWDVSGERRSISPDLRLLGPRLNSRAVPMGRIHGAVSASHRSALRRKALTRYRQLSQHCFGGVARRMAGAECIHARPRSADCPLQSLANDLIGAHAVFRDGVGELLRFDRLIAQGFQCCPRFREWASSNDVAGLQPP